MTISTPCIRLCVFDEAAGLCVGCGRTMAEIARWSAWPEARRLQVMALLPQRLGTPARQTQADRRTGARPVG